MEPAKVGDIFYNYSPEGIKHLILLLSSDREPGMEDGEEWWRVARFQLLPNGNPLGAQIALYTEKEIAKMEYAGRNISG